MGVEGEPPTEGEIQEVRTILAKKLEEIDSEELDQTFLARIANESDYLARFWKHVFANPGPQAEETAIMVVNTARYHQHSTTPMCPSGSPLGDLGPLGDLFVDLGPL